MRFSQFKHGHWEAKYLSGKDITNLMKKVGILAPFRVGGGPKVARSPKARLKLIRRVRDRMIAEGKIIPPINEAML